MLNRAVSAFTAKNIELLRAVAISSTVVASGFGNTRRSVSVNRIRADPQLAARHLDHVAHRQRICRWLTTDHRPHPAGPESSGEISSTVAPPCRSRPVASNPDLAPKLRKPSRHLILHRRKHALAMAKVHHLDRRSYAFNVGVVREHRVARQAEGFAVIREYDHQRIVEGPLLLRAGRSGHQTCGRRSGTPSRYIGRSSGSFFSPAPSGTSET